MVVIFEFVGSDDDNCLIVDNVFCCIWLLVFGFWIINVFFCVFGIFIWFDFDLLCFKRCFELSFDVRLLIELLGVVGLKFLVFNLFFLSIVLFLLWNEELLRLLVLFVFLSLWFLFLFCLLNYDVGFVVNFLFFNIVESVVWVNVVLILCLVFDGMVVFKIFEGKIFFFLILFMLW